MAFPQGVDFRATSGFVTDPTNYTHDLGTTVYPTASPQGNNIGWVSTSGLGARDRNAAIDPRLAGIVFTSAATVSTFKIALPAAGTYLINIAMGDATQAQSGQFLRIFDGATLLATPIPANTSTLSGSFLDATNTQYTAAAWPGSNTSISLTFAGTVASFECGGGAGVDWSIASIFIQSAGPPPVTITPVFPRMMFGPGMIALGGAAAAKAIERNRIVTRRGLLRARWNGEKA